MANSCYTDVAQDFLRLVGLSPTRPNLAFLTKLARAFMRLPYENLTKIISAAEITNPQERLRTPDIVLEDHIDVGAGGTCFSLTYFFQQILTFAGYDSWPVLCDRSYGPDTHCALIVPIGRMRYLMDPGYLMDQPLLVPEAGETVQHGPLGVLRLMRLGTSRQLLLITKRDGQSRIRYRLRDEPVGSLHFRRRWIDSFDWTMMRHLCISRQTSSGQLYMRDSLMRFIDGSKKRQRRINDSFAREAGLAFEMDANIIRQAQEALKRGGIG